VKYNNELKGRQKALFESLEFKKKIVIRSIADFLKFDPKLLV
jgi:hypothetical protein